MEKFCELCGATFVAKVNHAKYCVPCRGIMRRVRDKQEYERGGRERKARWYAGKIKPDPVLAEQGWMNLAFGIVEQAFRERDKGWLVEFGMEFLSFSGNPINQTKFDNLLEEMNGQT